MSEIEVRETEALVLPHTGELISLQDPLVCAHALTEIRELEQNLKEVKRVLTDALVEESKRQGTKTIYLPGIKAIVTGGEKVLWDTQALEDGLRKAGMADEQIAEIIRTEVSYSVVAGRAKRAASANPAYAKVIEACSSTIEERPTIAVRKG